MNEKPSRILGSVAAPSTVEEKLEDVGSTAIR